MKVKELNYYVGKKGYTDTIQLPAPGAQPLQYSLDILESYDNICLAKAYNRLNGHHEYHVYFINEDNKAIRKRLEGPFYNDETGEMRLVGYPDEIKAIYTAMVNQRKAEAASVIAKAKADGEQAEQNKIEAAIKESRALKLGEINQLNYDATGKLKQLVEDAKNTKEILKDKKVKALIDEILVYNVLRGETNSKIFKL